MTSQSSTSSFYSELKRRRVIKTCLLYVLLCWGIVQVAEILAPPLGFDSDAAIRSFLIASFVGFPITAILSWFFKITARGIEKTDAFVERRILNNIPPINDRRKESVGMYFGSSKPDADYDWIVSIETGPLESLSFGISGQILIGRSLDCDLAIVTPHVSRQHAKLDVEDGKLFVEDLGSANGTIVNGDTIDSRQVLKHDDEVKLQSVILRVSESFNRPYSERQAMNETTFISRDMVPGSSEENLGANATNKSPE
ncbi:MAG: FHA domain-containing protein [Pseudomonadota bacterium]